MRPAGGAATEQPQRYLEPLLLDESQVAEALQLGITSVRELVRAGEIPTVDLPNPLNLRKRMRRRLIARTDVEAFINKHRTGGRP